MYGFADGEQQHTGERERHSGYYQDLHQKVGVLKDPLAVLQNRRTEMKLDAARGTPAAAPAVAQGAALLC